MITRFLVLVFVVVMMWPQAGCAQDGPQQVYSGSVPPPVDREFRGAWVATVYNIDWPSKAGLPAAKQKAELIEILDRAEALNLNAIVFQVRPAADAFYKSQIEPWSQFLTGKMGRDPGYDPLAFAVEESHRRGLEIHAWFNPYRALANAKHPVSPGHISKKRPDLVVRYGSQLWLDPGNPEVTSYSIRVITDVVKRYDIDGVHIDDYFYPYPVKGEEFPDDKSWKRFGGKGARAEWRRENVNRFVRELYRSIKNEKPWVKFGISPFGIWRPGVPERTEAQLDAFAHLYADSRLWLRQGWLDYFSPQLYWSIQPTKQSFPLLLEWWVSQNVKGRHVWPGIATERIGKNRPATEMIEQIKIARKLANGHIHWNMKALMTNKGGISKLLPKTVYEEEVLVPAAPWLGKAELGVPSVTVTDSGAHWPAAKEVRFWVVQILRDGNWRTEVIGGNGKVSWETAPEAISVAGVDRYGNLGPAYVKEIR